ncbi:YceG family protein [Peribacillus saganii]|uniref:YceG family protein n=1 Tax=Peribacillus saganii TaxID=2303992 RepID=UPI001313F7A9|nr:YceG family protein [Peribacillus saganii]
MGAFVQYSKINPVLIQFNNNEWLSLLEKSLSEREHYSTQNNTIQFGQVCARFLGVDGDEDDYYNMLFELTQNPRIQVHVLSGHLRKEIVREQFQAIQTVLEINQSESLSVNRFIAFLEGRDLIPALKDQSVHRHLRESLVRVLQMFIQEHPGGFQHPDFRRVIVDLIKWMWNHLNESISIQMADGRLPCILWYGDATKSEIYFLYLAKLIGFDLLVFDPSGIDIFKSLDPDRKLMVVREYNLKKEAREFPKSRAVRKATVAYQASKEIERILHTDDSPIYKQWQYRSHVPASITLKTTFDELFLMSREKAFIRPNFHIEGQTVYIPSLFAKISGVMASQKEYWDRLEDLKAGELTLFIRYFPFTHNVTVNQQYHYHHSLNREGVLDPEKIIKSNWWKYKQLPIGVQHAIAAGISRVCENPKLLKEDHESPYDLQLYLFGQFTRLPESVVKLFLKFDYPQEVPRIILYNSGTVAGFSRSDAALLLLLNELGLDILMFNPSGLRDLELYIDDRFFDIHLMDQFEFNLEYKERPVSIWRKLINLKNNIKK